MSKFQRQITKKTLTLGQPETIQLPRNNAIRYLILRLAGSITISGGTTSGTVNDANPWELITQLTIRRDGKDTVFQLPAKYLYRLNQLLFGTLPSNAALASGAAQTNTAVNGVLVIPFENILGVKPFDTLLQGRGLSSLDLLIEVASAASVLVDGGDRTIAVGTTAFTLDVTAVEELNVEGFVFGDLRTYIAQQVTVSGTANNFQIKPLPVGNRYKGFILVTEDVGVAGGGDLSNSILSGRVRLKSGSEVFVDVEAVLLRDAMKQRFGLETLPTGYYFLDLMPDGMLNQTLDVRNGTGRETLEMEVDVTVGAGVTTIKVIALEYIAPVVATNK